MRDLWFYDWMSRVARLNYRLKIMLVAFVGTHIPLISVAVYLALQTSPDWQSFIGTVSVTLVATLAGTAMTLFVLNQLLKPVLLTSRTLKAYRETREVGALPRHYADEVGTLMADAGDTIEHLEGALDRLEHIDDATGLANRRRLLETMDALLSRDAGFVVSVLRFADHARIAATFDSGPAELAVSVLARRIAGHLDGDEVLARVGPSEFAFLTRTKADEFDPAAGAYVRLARIIEACEGEVSVGGVEIKPSLQGGLATAPQDGADAETLLDNAVAAAAQGGLATPVVIHSPEARQAAQTRFQLEHDLRRALDQGQLSLHYQPIVDLGASRVAGAEALMRWRHPEHGMIAPAEFIPIAEDSGLIQSMGLWALGEACDQARAWADAGLLNLRVAVNLSPRQFLDDDLTGHVTRALDAARISPNLLEIELTETAAMVDQAYTRRVFTELRDLGVSIAIDDFGTGYASMSYLRKLPFNKLKIDREFVQDVHQRGDSQAICDALIALSNGLGIDILAEGTEKEEEVRYLYERGCERFQGYFFSRPLPSGEFEETSRALMLRAMRQRMAAVDPAEDEIDWAHTA